MNMRTLGVMAVAGLAVNCADAAPPPPPPDPAAVWAERFAALPANSPPSILLVLCQGALKDQSVLSRTLPPAESERCAAVLLEEAKTLLAAGNPAGARRQIDLAREAGASVEQVATIEKELKRKEEQAAAVGAKAAALQAAIVRRAYPDILGNLFLDQGLDIKVSVKGRNADRLYLEYPLFNAVWGRKFETTGSFNAWREMGFKKVDLNDGWNYHVVYTLGG